MASKHCEKCKCLTCVKLHSGECSVECYKCKAYTRYCSEYKDIRG